MAFAIPSAFADCGKCKKHEGEDGEKKDTVSLVDCGKDHGKKECPEGCEKECCKKKEATMLAKDCGKKKECPEDCKKEEPTALADCGKCEKHDDEEKKEEKKEETLLADSDDDGCKDGGCKKTVA